MLIDGITELARKEIVETSFFKWLPYIIAGFVLFSLFSILYYIKDEELFLVIGFVLALVITIYPTWTDKIYVNTGKYEYKVMIDDTVSMNEFYEKYEIMEQDGLIYIIREKEE